MPGYLAVSILTQSLKGQLLIQLTIRLIRQRG